MHRLEFDARAEEHEASTNQWIDVEHSPDDIRGVDKLEPPPPPHSSPVSKTAIGHRRSQKSPGHPLRPSLSVSYNIDDASGFGTSLDLHETRPSRHLWSLNRIRTQRTTRAKETEVIVHYVRPGDSLPGVALKYNVSLAALRNANKLWTNDTIYFREQLYTPIRAISSSAASSSARSSLDSAAEGETGACHDTGMDSFPFSAAVCATIRITEPEPSGGISIILQTSASSPTVCVFGKCLAGQYLEWSQGGDHEPAFIGFGVSLSDGGDKPEFELDVVSGVKRSGKMMPRCGHRVSDLRWEATPSRWKKHRVARRLLGRSNYSPVPR
ncbi:hypothetical protein BU17DRAFT_83654 [Hysterangium stoloniferum]|nr:hypothetical protein BU17DRAFT_83654 [Hysterangium stoloniferum]